MAAPGRRVAEPVVQVRQPAQVQSHQLHQVSKLLRQAARPPEVARKEQFLRQCNAGSEERPDCDIKTRQNRRH